MTTPTSPAGLPKRKRTMATASPPIDNGPDSKQPPLTFIEHEQAILSAHRTLLELVRRAEEAGHGFTVAVHAGARQRGWSIGLERDVIPIMGATNP